MKAATIVLFLASANAQVFRGLPENCLHDCENAKIKLPYIMRGEDTPCPIQPRAVDLWNAFIRSPKEVCNTDQIQFVVCNYCLRRGQTLLGDYQLESAKVMSDIECNQDLNQITVATCEEILGTTEAPVTEAPATAAPTVAAAEAPETEASVGGSGPVLATLAARMSAKKSPPPTTIHPEPKTPPTSPPGAQKSPPTMPPEGSLIDDVAPTIAAPAPTTAAPAAKEAPVFDFAPAARRAPVARRAPKERSAPAKKALPLIGAPVARRAPKERSAPAKKALPLMGAPVARRAPNERSARAKRALPLMEAPAARRAPKERSAPAGTSGTAFNTTKV